MGTKVQCKSYLPGYSMRDLNEDSNSFSWPLYYGDKNLTNGQYYNSYMPRAVSEAYPGYDKDAVKRQMLEHEAIFKDQVSELHRLYKIQKDLMEEVKSKDIRKNLIAAETSMSSSPLTSQITSEDARKWHIPSFPLPNSVCAKPSVSGAEDIHSSLSSMRGSSTQAGPLPIQNGGGSKDVELLESRPTKLRKMIDLQLPADEYIDTEEEEEEQFRDEKISGMPSYLCNGNQKMVSGSGAKLCVGNNEKSGCRGDASRSDSCLRSTNSVADLNEPIPVEEANNSRYLDLLGHASRDEENEGHERFAKPKSQLQGLPKEISLNSHYGSSNGTAENRYLENNDNGRRWFSHMLEAGPSKSNLKSAPQGLPHETPTTPSQPIQVLFNKAHQAPNFLLTNQSKVDLWRERNHVISNNIHPELGVASNMSSSYPIASSSDLFNSWPHSVSSWETPSSSLSQKSMSVQTHPILNSSGILSRSAQTAGQTYGIFGDGWQHLNSHPRSNSSFESELPSRNGCYYGSSSASKEPLVQVPSISYNYLKCSNENNVASEHIINCDSGKLDKGSSSIDMKFAKEVNLNVVFSPEAVPEQSLEVKDRERKNEDHVAMLPWLRAKPSCKKDATSIGRDLNVGELGFLQSSVNQSVNKNEAGDSQIVTQNLKSGSGSNNIEAMVERSDFLSNKKILGYPIFEKPHISRNEASSLTSPSEVEVENNKKSRVLDINLPFDATVPDLSQKGAAEALVIEKKSDVKVDIDLNSYVSEDEASLKPTVLSSNVKTVGIDLEAPIVPEIEEDVIHEENPQKVQEAPLQSPEHKTQELQDEFIRVAAEAIVSISSSSLHCHHDVTAVAISSSDPENPLDDATCNSSEASVNDPLNWFVEIVSSCGNDIESRIDAFFRGKNGEDNEESLSEEFDYFESMTLKLTETAEEEYMPKPLVPENFKVEESGTTLLSNRPRKGQARRGRQRRDFQRDILPGLASLSRHEVTEDLQTFGGMMRATGHSWHSGLTRRNSTRNGCGRGRRRAIVSSPPPPPPPPVAATTTCTPLVQQLTNVEVGLEDRSLTGWGKTTRRPRRQRCPAGNPPTVAMT